MKDLKLSGLCWFAKMGVSEPDEILRVMQEERVGKKSIQKLGTTQRYQWKNTHKRKQSCLRYTFLPHINLLLCHIQHLRPESMCCTPSEVYLVVTQE